MNNYYTILSRYHHVYFDNCFGSVKLLLESMGVAHFEATGVASLLTCNLTCRKANFLVRQWG